MGFQEYLIECEKIIEPTIGVYKVIREFIFRSELLAHKKSSIVIDSYNYNLCLLNR